jgi:undecaprenyl-diphosphatase
MQPTTRRTAAAVIGFVAVTLLAAIDRGAAALHVDRPVTDWAVDERTSGWTAFFRGVTNLGNPGVAFVGGLVLAALAAARSRFAALLLLALALARPLASTVVKVLVDRARPSVHHLTAATGASYPSGHVLAAIVFWGAVPVPMLLWGAARGFVRTAVAVAVAAVTVVAASRVYLGVHWLSDVIGGALLGALLLVPVYALGLSRLDE